jgi:CRISPR system Cascade subunit CasA
MTKKPKVAGQTERRFNLIEENWIPIIGAGMVSLRRIFQDLSLLNLAGNPIQVLSMIKLLLALCQTACTPKDELEWDALGPDGLADKVLRYLEEHRDCFWLYGEKPFLQMPSVKDRIIARKKQELAKAENKTKQKDAEENAKPKPIGLGYYPDIPADNNTVLTGDQIFRPLSDAEKALFIVTLMNFALGGKRVEKNIEPFSSGYVKSNSAKSAPSLGNHWGYLHSFVTGDTLVTTLWLNLLTREDIEAHTEWHCDIKGRPAGIPPWEKMPRGEDCKTARQLKESYMGCLIAMSRFVLLEEDGIYYAEGIQYPSHKEGWQEPTMCIDSNRGKLLWADPGKKPWRELTALLSFLGSNPQNNYICPQLQCALHKTRNKKMKIGIWSGGLKVRANSGDQSVKQDDNFVYSETYLFSSDLELKYGYLEKEMKRLERYNKFLRGRVFGYCSSVGYDSKIYMDKASELFWQLCERKFQPLVYAATGENKEEIKALKKCFFQFVRKAYETCFPKSTMKQPQYWVKYHPDTYSLKFKKKRKPA